MDSIVALSILLAFFLLVALVSLLRPVYLRHPFFRFFRALFPSWKFFDDIGVVPRLYYQYEMQPAECIAADWHEAIPPGRAMRKWYGLGLNPESNLYLAERTLVERLVADLEEPGLIKPGCVAETVSYRLVHRLVGDRIQAHAACGRYRFKIVLFDPCIEQLEDEVLLSPWYVLNHSNGC